MTLVEIALEDGERGVLSVRASEITALLLPRPESGISRLRIYVQGTEKPFIAMSRVAEEIEALRTRLIAAMESAP